MLEREGELGGRAEGIGWRCVRGGREVEGLAMMYKSVGQLMDRFNET